MTERAQRIREVARQALYRTPNDQECEVLIECFVHFSHNTFPPFTSSKQAISFTM